MAGDRRSATGRVRKYKRNVPSLWDSVDDEGWMAGVALMCTARPPPGQHLKGICRTDMVGQVIVSDTWGGWTRPRANSLRPLLSLSSPTEEREREREREPGIHFFFPALYTSMRAAKRQSFRGSRNFFSFRICTRHIGNYCEYIMFFFSVQSRPE